MTLGTCDITLITEAVTVIRDAADTAASDHPDLKVCCWSTERIANQESVIETLVHVDGYEDTRHVAIPVSGGTAAHIGLWGPNPARMVADWLESTAGLHGRKAADTDASRSACGCALSACQWCNDEDTPCADLRFAEQISLLILGKAHLAHAHATFTTR